MIPRIRKGNDFRHIWPITWNGQPEDFSDATDIVLTATVYGKVKTLVEGVDYHIDGGTVVVDFTPAICDITGTYTVELNYIKPSAEFTDGDRRSAVDVQAFQIVNTSAEANATEGVSLPSEAMAAYALKYEDLSPENIAELQRPATEAAESIGELEQTIEGNEATRQSNESDRIGAEGIRDTNETARINAEGIRDTNETARINAEGIRDANETDRINAESDRVDAEDLRDQAEVAREEAEGLRQTNTATAIQNAVEATTAANTAAGTANDAAATANTAADNANEMSSHPPVIIDDYWHNWNFTTDQYETTGQYARGDSAIEGSLVLQTTGQSAVDVMSQKAVTDELDQLAGDVNQIEVKDAVQSAKIRDIENVLSTANLNQSAQLSVSGVSPLSLPKNAANGGMSVKLEGLTTDVGGVITNFVSTGRVRSVDKNGLNPTALYLTAPELRSIDTVKDEIRKGANGYELVKRIGVNNIDGNTNFSYFREINEQMVSVSFPVRGGDRRKGYGMVDLINFKTLSSQEYISKEVEGIYSSGSPTLADVLIDKSRLSESTLNGIKDYFTANPDVFSYELETPIIIPISYGGVLNSAENGTVYHEPIIADAGVYSGRMDILLTDYPIATIEEIIKHVDGVDTYLNAASAVIAGDGLSFTHPDLASGDLVLFTYAFDKESTNGNITATFYDSNVVKIDTVTGKAYRINEVVTNGVLTRTLTEV